MPEELETLRTHQFVRPGLILVAEQDSAVRQAIKDRLEHSLHTVTCVGSVAEAKRAIKEEPPELILAGEKLPDGTGFDLCRDIKDNAGTQYTPVMILSGQGRHGAEVEAAECGANEVLYKPVDPQLLEMRVCALLKYGRVVTALQTARRELEQRVASRTAELLQANEELKREIAGHQQTETVLRETTEALRRLVAASPLAIVTLNPNGSVRTWNASAERIFGWTEAEVLGRRSPVVSEQQLDAFDLVDAKADERNALLLRCPRKDGQPVEVITWLATVRNEAGEIVFKMGMFSDITERRRLESQLRQAHKMEAIGQLAGGVAHDFNNLLTVINGRSELLLTRLESGDSRRRDLELVLKTGRRAATLTRQLLAFGRRQVLEPRVLSLNTVIDEVQRMLRSLIREDIKLTFLPTPDLHSVKVDSGQIEQVLVNLVVNARDAMPGGGEMLIRTANVRLDYAYHGAVEQIEPGEYVVLSVVDTGCGMDAATQARVFEPFFTTKKNGEGTGLGLSTVYGIIKQSGGYIDLSTHVGAGTTFKIYLPRILGMIVPASSSQAVSAVTSGEAILLVEDEDEVRDLTRDLLESYGYSVLLAHDGVDALQVAAAHKGPIHLLVTDMVMPNMGGPELAERFRLRQPQAKILFMSGYAGHPFAGGESLAAGIHFVQKPFTPRGLAGKVREALSA